VALNTIINTTSQKMTNLHLAKISQISCIKLYATLTCISTTYKTDKLLKWAGSLLSRTNTVIPVLRSHLSDKEKVVFYDGRPQNRGSIHMKFSITGQENGDLLISVIQLGTGLRIFAHLFLKLSWRTL